MCYVLIVLFYSVRVWDVAILIPNLIFMTYLLTKFSRARLKLRAANSPIFFTFYCLVNFDFYIDNTYLIFSTIICCKLVFILLIIINDICLGFIQCVYEYNEMLNFNDTQF